MRLGFDEQHLKNFLSFGNRWSSLKFLEGMNLITGWDYDLKRSNGSGKTSLLSATQFALFGKAKDLNKQQVVNWKNGKDCEVSLTLQKGDNSYLFKRGIKPDFFEVYENGNPIPIERDIRAFQREIENDLLGMDLKLFNHILFCNLGDTSLINTKKDDKRKLIEKTFNLEVFSRMNEKLNERIRNNKAKIEKLDYQIDFSSKRIEELRKEAEGITLPDIEYHKRKYQEAQKKCESLGYSEESLDEKIAEVKKKHEEHRKWYEIYRGNIEDAEQQLKFLKRERKELKERTEKLQEELRKKREQLEYYEKKVAVYKEDYGTEIEKNKKEKEELENRINEYKSLIATQKKLIESLPNPESFKDEFVCPTCHSEVEYEHIKDYTERRTAEYQDTISTFEESLKRKMEERKEIVAEIERLEKLKKEKDSLEMKLSSLQSEDLESKESEIEEANKKFEYLDDAEKELESGIEQDKENYKERFDKATELHKEMEELEKKRKLLYQYIKEVEIAKTSLDNAEENKKRLEEEKQDKERKIQEINSEIKKLEKDKKKAVKAGDYFNYMKTLLKDENVKQYALSTIIPFMNAKTNEYISESGFSFFIEVDKWMDIAIKGPGIGSNSISNFSGGEAKSIDLALKFAIMDTAKTQSGVFPDILILDEVLDTSIDSVGLENVINIVKYRQKKDDLKLFLISHREDATSNFDRIYRVNKNNGFSHL